MRPAVLVVDDEPHNIDLVRRLLRADYEVVGTGSPEAALALLRERRFCILVSDHRMPGMSGTELLSHSWRLQPTTKRVLMTAYGELGAVVDAINLGHIDYFLPKPFDADTFRSRLAQLRMQYEQAQAQEGGAKDLEQSLAARERELLSVVQQLERKNEQLREAALRDWLTGAYNHRSLHERLQQEVGRARREQDDVSLLFLSVDHFTGFNELNGHGAGDALLQRVASFLSGSLPGAPSGRVSDVVARYNADVFAILLPATGKEGALVRARQLVTCFRKLDLSSLGVPPEGRLHLSCGLAAFPDDCGSADDLVLCAEDALRRAKDEGRDRAVAWSLPSANHPVLSRSFTSLVNAVTPQLRRAEALFSLTFQLSPLTRSERPQGLPGTAVEVFEQQVLEVVCGSSLVPREELVGLLSERPGTLHVLLRPAEPRAWLTGMLEDRAARIAEAVERGLRSHAEEHGGGVLRVVSTQSAELNLTRGPFAQQAQRLCASGQAHLGSALEQRRSRERLELQRIIAAGEIQSLAQPILGGLEGRRVGFELLSRGPTQGWFRNPASLLDIAEDVGLTPELDLCLIEQSLRNARDVPRDALVFINVLPSTLLDPLFCGQRLERLLGELGLPASRLVLEVSERQGVDVSKELLEGLAQLRALEVSLALDDLGTRNANLSEIATFRPDWLKVDRSLVTGIHEDVVKQNLVRAVVDFGRSQGAHVLAEGIEHPAELEMLQSLNVSYFQGFLLGRPQPLERAEAPAVAAATAAV